MRPPTLRAALCGATIVALAAFAASALAEEPTGFQTGQASMLDAVAPGATVERIITVGDTLPNGYRFESIPDGIAIYENGGGSGDDRRVAGAKSGDEGDRVDVFVNHETSTVPFPFTFPGSTSRVCCAERLRQRAGEPPDAQRRDRRLLDGKLAITSSRELPALLLELPRDEEGGV